MNNCCFVDGAMVEQALFFQTLGCSAPIFPKQKMFDLEKFQVEDCLVLFLKQIMFCLDLFQWQASSCPAHFWVFSSTPKCWPTTLQRLGLKPSSGIVPKTCYVQVCVCQLSLWPFLTYQDRSEPPTTAHLDNCQQALFIFKARVPWRMLVCPTCGSFGSVAGFRRACFGFSLLVPQVFEVAMVVVLPQGVIEILQNPLIYFYIGIFL